MSQANGIAIQTLREAKHFTGSQLAREAGITRQHLGRIERGECGASVSTIQSIAEALGVPIGAISNSDLVAAK